MWTFLARKNSFHRRNGSIVKLIRLIYLFKFNKYILCNANSLNIFFSRKGFLAQRGTIAKSFNAAVLIYLNIFDCDTQKQYLIQIDHAREGHIKF